jgi:hypothetical protein
LYYILYIKAGDADLTNTAAFLANHYFSQTMPAGQRRELMRLEQSDLIYRYGSRVGKRKHPCSLLLAEQDGEIVGLVFCFLLLLNILKSFNLS